MGHAEQAPQTVTDLERFRRGYVDPCTYDVWYTVSGDEGQTWAVPRRVNERPIAGQEFLGAQDQSRPGEFIGMASTAGQTMPIWIAGTHAYMTCIDR